MLGHRGDAEDATQHILVKVVTHLSPTPEDRTLAREVRPSCTQGRRLVLSRDERLALVPVDLLGPDGAEAAVVVETTHDAFRQRPRPRPRAARRLP